MKIQCDVCEKEEALIFCTADEAALCKNCDVRIHYANKLASKHPRFSLVHPRYDESPRCDICQERRALVFCQEDRALFCKECDIPIHQANDHTKKHNRFLLTGVKIALPDSSCQATASSSTSLSETEIKSATSESNIQPFANCSDSSSNPWWDIESNQQGSEYLMENLPNWHVEDLLYTSSQYGFSKIYDQMPPFR